MSVLLVMMYLLITAGSGYTVCSLTRIRASQNFSADGATDVAGIYYLMFTTFSSKRESFWCYGISIHMNFTGLFIDVYGFTVGSSGLAYLGLGVGFILSTVIAAWGGNLIYTRVRSLAPPYPLPSVT